MVKEIFQNINELLFTPKEFWIGQKDKDYGRWQLFVGFYISLLLASALAVFIGAWFGSAHFYIGFALLKSLREIALFVMLYFVSIYIVNQLISAYGGEKNMPKVKKLVVYSLTPYLLISMVTGLFPGLYILDIVGLYSAYLFWTGAKELILVPEKKKVEFILISVILCLFVFGFLSIMLWKIFVELY